MKDLDEFETEEELKKYLETLSLSELIEIYYIQACEISRIRQIFQSVVNKQADSIQNSVVLFP